MMSANQLKERISQLVAKTEPELLDHTLGGKWRIVEDLGAGATSRTYRAESTVYRAEREGKSVAVKVYKRWVLERRDEIDRLVHGFEIMQTIDHPNLMKVLELDVDEEAGIVYSVFEYLGKVTLTRFVDQSVGPIPFATIKGILSGLFSGVATLHSTGIIHRDIKPDNVMINLQPDGSYQPKLVDFGVVRRLSDAPLTSAGEFLGTTRYAPPEWLTRAKDNLGRELSDDRRVDIYSLGSTLYKMVTKAEPFADIGPNYARLVQAVMDPSVTLFHHGLPRVDGLREREEGEFLECLGYWLTAKSPSGRPATVEEVQTAAMASLDGEWWQHLVSLAEESYVTGIVATAQDSFPDADEYPTSPDDDPFSLLHRDNDFVRAGEICERALLSLRGRESRIELLRAAISYYETAHAADPAVKDEDRVDFAEIDRRCARLKDERDRLQTGT